MYLKTEQTTVIKVLESITYLFEYYSNISVE